MSHDNVDLTKQIERLTKERDEARVTLCIEVAETNCDFRKVMSSPAQVASEYGWDYLIADLEDDMVDLADRVFARDNDLPTEPRAEND